MKRSLLIVNADDFGWSERISDGIVDAHARGIVTSATLLATMPAAAYAARLARATPSLDVGVHLTYQAGRPLLDPRAIGALFTSDGRPRFGIAGLWGAVLVSRRARRELREHFRSQIQFALDHGLRPSHLDTHKHIHLFPPISGIVCELAVEFGIPAVRFVYERLGTPGAVTTRVILGALAWTVPINLGHIRSRRLACTDRLLGIAMTGRWTRDALLGILDQLRPGWIELVVHPGYPDGLDPRETRLTASREIERQILTDGEVINRCRSQKIVLASFRDLSAARNANR